MAVRPNGAAGEQRRPKKKRPKSRRPGREHDARAQKEINQIEGRRRRCRGPCMQINQPTKKKKQYRVVRRTGQRKHGADTRVGRMRVAVQWRPASQGTPKPSMAPFPLRLLRTATLPRRREARRADCSAPCLPAGLGRGSNGNGGRAISPPACRVPVSWIPGLWIQWQWQWRAGLSEDPAGGHISNM